MYNSNWIKKSIRNTNAIAYILKLALIRVINNRLEVAKEERQKKEKIKKKQKTEAMAAKRYKVRKEMSSFSKKKDKNDIKKNTDLD